MDYLGAHMSIAGGIHNAPERGAAVGCGVIQVFTQNANRWQGKAVSEADAALFQAKWRACGLHDVASHDIYLINLSAPPGELRDRSISAFGEEMRRCARLGIGKIIMHPGAHQGDGEATGIRRIVEATPSSSSRRSSAAPPIPGASASASIPATSSPPATTFPPKAPTTGRSMSLTGWWGSPVSRPST
jgi:endonuclease IV